MMLHRIEQLGKVARRFGCTYFRHEIRLSDSTLGAKGLLPRWGGPLFHVGAAHSFSEWAITMVASRSRNSSVPRSGAARCGGVDGWQSHRRLVSASLLESLGAKSRVVTEVEVEVTA
jgi:hypothetical protein